MLDQNFIEIRKCPKLKI